MRTLYSVQLRTKPLSNVLPSDHTYLPDLIDDDQYSRRECKTKAPEPRHSVAGPSDQPTAAQKQGRDDHFMVKNQLCLSDIYVWEKILGRHRVLVNCPMVPWDRQVILTPPWWIYAYHLRVRSFRGGNHSNYKYEKNQSLFTGGPGAGANYGPPKYCKFL